jgi:hypothetical protein
LAIPAAVRVIEVSRSSEIDEFARGDMRAHIEPHGLTLVGWVLGHGSRITEITLHTSAGQVIRAPVDVARPDIVKAFGELPDASRSGFRIDLEPDDLGESELLIRAVLGPDRSATLGTVRVHVSARNRARASVRALFDRLRNRERPPVAWTVLAPPAERHKVLHGLNGWLFLRRDPNDVIGQHTGRVRLGRRKRRMWTVLLKRRMAVLDRIGAVWLCTVIPDKNFVYPEHLPPAIVPSRRRLLHEFLDLGAGIGAPVVYGLDDLEGAKHREQLYPQTDTHWNQLGSYVVYLAICRALSESGLAVSPVPEAAIEWCKEPFAGDLGSKLYPQVNGVTIRAKLTTHEAANVFDNRVQNHGRVIIFEQNRVDGPSCVVFGESFVQNLLPFLKESFRRLVFVHTSMLVQEVVEAERPDAVLTISLERFLAQVPDDDDALTRLHRTVHEKVQLGRLSPEAEPFLREIPRSPDCGAGEQVGTLPWSASPASEPAPRPEFEARFG